VPLHLYCILPPDGSTPEAVGVDGAPVRGVPCGSVSCVVSEHDETPAASPERVRAHNAVITACMDRRVTPVPLRFGQAVADEAALREGIGRDVARWTSLLATFAGHAEYGVRVDREASERPEAVREMHPAAANPGTHYMAALARKHAAAADRRMEGERIAALILERAGDTVRDSRVDSGPAAGSVVSVAHLVAWERATSYHAAVAAVRDVEPALTFRCSGPWPPYSFVT
jgi:hypothetical protein